jgi:hypothetical protein
MKVKDVKSFNIILETLINANELLLEKEAEDLKESLSSLFINVKPKLCLNNYSLLYDLNRTVSELYKNKSELQYKLNNYIIEYTGDEYFNDYVLESIEILKNCNSLDDIIYLRENINESVLKATNAIKNGFGAKHDKIVARDKKWLSTNKKKILSLNFDEVELEVVSDYKTTFEGLINRHNIFDKNFANSANMDDIGSKISRFEDKNGNLKNGLDNYFRTGTSRREIGLRKVSGDSAREAVENMVAYCEAFLAGKSFLEEKLNNIIVAINDDNTKSSKATKKEPSIKSDETEVKEEPVGYDTKNNEKPLTFDANGKIKESFNLLALLEANEEEQKEENKEKPEESVESEPRGLKDRQVGIAVLLSVAEERYFDYIGILKGLVE